MVAYGRLLGEAAVLLRQTDDARNFYERAMSVCERLHFRPELAIVHLDLAELLIGSVPDEQRIAVEHLEFAIAEFQQMGMQPFLERALQWGRAPGSRKAAKRLHVTGRSIDGLTEREREVSALVARGLSNREIAQKLVISQATVEVHVKHVLSKLGFRSRSQIAVWFSESKPTLGR
jgi:DNA-binding CsgD family transcriptional regulator